MTCLYCGKKLGFFSRYKDTPFCSEQHLRTHQDQMEKALMERLGSKVAAPAALKDESPSAPAETPIVARRGAPAQDAGGNRFEEVVVERPTHFETTLEDAPLRRGAPRVFPGADAAASALPPIPAAERPIDKRALLDLPPTAPSTSRAPQAQPQASEEEIPAPLCEDFFEAEQRPLPALVTNRPWFSPSSFAIIIQSEFCSPVLPDYRPRLHPALADTEFSLDPQSVNAEAWQQAAAIPPESGAADFATSTPSIPSLSGLQPSGMPSIASLAGEPATDIWEAFPAEEELLALAFDHASPDELLAAQSSRSQRFLPIGQRPEVPMRPRQRYPYAANRVHTKWQHGLESASLYSFTAADEWEGVHPPAYENPLASQVQAAPAELLPQVHIQLSLRALAAQTIQEEEGTAFEREPASFRASPLPVASLPSGSSASLDWQAYPALPQAASQWQPQFSFPRSRPAGRMQGLSYPSLFQLSPVLPPRPQGVALHG